MTTSTTARMFLSVLLLFTILTTPRAEAQTSLFADGFESAGTSAWSASTRTRTLGLDSILENQGQITGFPPDPIFLLDAAIPNSFLASLNPDQRSLISAELTFLWSSESFDDVLEVRFVRGGVHYPWIRIFRAPGIGVASERVTVRLGGPLIGPSDDFALEFTRSEGEGPIGIFDVAFHGLFAEE